MNKVIFLFLTLFNILISFSQQKNGVSFFDADANLTFKLNENFEFGNTNVEPFFVPSEILIRFGIGYEYKKDSGLFIRTTAEVTDFDTINLTGSQVGGTASSFNKISADVDILAAKLSIGKAF